MKKKIISIYLTILKYLAQAQLVKNKPLIIGITGSAGKSSCTRLVANVLKQDFKVKYTKKGNSETGIPFEILNIPVKNYSSLEWLTILFKGFNQVLFNWEEYSIFVVEMGIDSDQYPKDMSTLLDIVSPEIGVVLNVNNVHLEHFKGPKETITVAKEKSKLLFSLPQNGLAIINQDQKELTSLTEKIKAIKKTYSIKNNADIKLLSHDVSLEKTVFTFSFENKNYTITLNKKLAFKESFGNIATTILIGNFLNLETEKIISSIEKNYEVLPGRGTLLDGINGSTIIDSSYNSSLEPTSASLRLLSEIKKSKNRTIAILGDMRELGSKAALDHQLLEKVALSNADHIYSVGPLTSQYFLSKKIRKYLNPYSLLKDLKKDIKKDDLILVKGSQNTILLETIVREIIKNKKDKKKLCRQTPYWDKQREILKKQAQ
jgi:UDP-N-acetylmuramoyl-tripeptide--D-alanyl-D-alanine ligase